MARRKKTEPAEEIEPAPEPTEKVPEAPPEAAAVLEVGHTISCALGEVGKVRAELCAHLPKGSSVSTRRAGKLATLTIVRVG